MTDMSYFTVLFLFVCSTSFVLGTYILLADPKVQLNRIFFLGSLSLSVWSFCFAVALTAPDAETCLFWRRASALGWSVFYGFWLHFFFILNGYRWISTKKWICLVIYAPGILSMYLFGLSAKMAEQQYHLVHYTYGWVNVAVNNGWDFFFYIYFLVYVLLSLFLLYRWNRTSSSPVVKKQARIIFYSFLITAVLGTLTDLLNNTFGVVHLPQMAPAFFAVPMICLGYCIKKYHLMDQIISKTEMILSSSGKNIIYVISSLTLILGSVLYFVQFYLFGDEPLTEALVSGIELLLVGILLLIFQRMKSSPSSMELIYTLTILFVIPMFTIKFANHANVTAWAFVFIILIYSLVFNERLPMMAAAGAAFLSQLYLWISVPQLAIHIGSRDYIGRISSLFIAFGAAVAINKLYINKLKENAQQIELQKMLSKISTDFITVNQANIQSKISQAFKKLGIFFQLDRIHLYILQTRYRGFPENTIWEKHPQTDSFRSNPLEWMRYMEQKSIIFMSDIDQLPEEAGPIKQDLEERHIRSILSLPVLIRGSKIGFVNFESKDPALGRKKGQINGLQIVCNMISDAMVKVNAEKRIESLAYYDALTQLPNQVQFKNLADLAISQVQHTKEQLGIVFFDLDAFKMVNDSFGHASGDLLIKKVADTLSCRTKSSDTVTRYGGDEFLILLNHVAGAQEVKDTIIHILSVFQKPFVLSGKEFFLTASIGVAMFPKDGKDTTTLINNADTAMYHARESGKNHYAFFSEEMRTKGQSKAKLMNSLFKALDQNELKLIYQPIVDLHTGKIAGLEALMRWEHPELGNIPPSVFIPLAEQSGMINRIDQWALRTACLQNEHWMKQGLGPVRMAVNLSVVQIHDPELIEKIEATLQETGLDPSLLELEITESAMMEEADYFIDVVQKLKKTGVWISIDDFGTGYSSLERLKALPFDSLKIDITFVRGIGGGTKDQAVIDVIINLAKSLDLKLIAEGVENQQQLDFLKQRQCDQVQGYYYYKPMAAEGIEKLLKDNRFN